MLSRVPEVPLPNGSFVWINFPFGPDVPGPVRHIANVFGFRVVTSGLQVLLAYSSSGPWRGGAPSIRLALLSSRMQKRSR